MEPVRVSNELSDLNSPVQLGLALMYGGAHLLLAPFPWQLGGASLRMILTLPELLFWWYLFRGRGRSWDDLHAPSPPFRNLASVFHPVRIGQFVFRDVWQYRAGLSATGTTLADPAHAWGGWSGARLGTSQIAPTFNLEARHFERTAYCCPPALRYEEYPGLIQSG